MSLVEGMTLNDDISRFVCLVTNNILLQCAAMFLAYNGREIFVLLVFSRKPVTDCTKLVSLEELMSVAN